MSESELLQQKMKKQSDLQKKIRETAPNQLHELSKQDCLVYLLYWREKCLSLEKHLLEISSVPSDSWGWRELRKRTAREALGLNPDGSPVQDAESK